MVEIFSFQVLDAQNFVCVCACACALIQRAFAISKGAL